jgi:hypothetical protein
VQAIAGKGWVVVLLLLLWPWQRWLLLHLLLVCCMVFLQCKEAELQQHDVVGGAAVKLKA